MSPLLALIGIGTYLRWKEDRFERLRKALTLPLVAAVILGALFPLVMERYEVLAAVGMTLAFWVVLSQFPALSERLSGGRSIAGVPAGFWGMTLGHVGLAVTVVASP